MLNKNIIIRSEYITLSQLLKFGNVISSGGETKHFLASNRIEINGVLDSRRGKKLYPGDKVTINNDLCLTLVKN